MLVPIFIIIIINFFKEDFPDLKKKSFVQSYIHDNMHIHFSQTHNEMAYFHGVILVTWKATDRSRCIVRVIQCTKRSFDSMDVVLPVSKAKVDTHVNGRTDDIFSVVLQ